jgi:hypothetical protein
MLKTVVLAKMGVRDIKDKELRQTGSLSGRSNTLCLSRQWVAISCMRARR